MWLGLLVGCILGADPKLLGSVKDWDAVLAILLLPIVYPVGIFIDNLADDLLRPIGRRIRPQYLFGIDETTGFEVFLRGSQCPVKGSAVSRVEPVARIEGQEINFGPLRELCRLVHQKPTLVNTGL